MQVERQNSELINLYVASHRLHSTLEYDQVVQIVKEIAINLLGDWLRDWLDVKEPKGMG